jgi:hypothetical protein
MTSSGAPDSEALTLIAARYGATAQELTAVLELLAKYGVFGQNLKALESAIKRWAFNTESHREAGKRGGRRKEIDTDSAFAVLFNAFLSELQFREMPISSKAEIAADSAYESQAAIAERVVREYEPGLSDANTRTRAKKLINHRNYLRRIREVSDRDDEFAIDFHGTPAPIKAPRKRKAETTLNIIRRAVRARGETS